MGTKVQVKCRECGTPTTVDLGIDVNPLNLAPDIAAKNIQPYGYSFYYRITTAQIKEFVTRKCKVYAPNIEIDVFPFYCERKRRKGEPHRGYASLRIAFSDAATINREKGDYFASIGESDTNFKLEKRIETNIINLYGYNRSAVSEWLKDYEKMEQLEREHGMTEAFVRNISQYTTPRMIRDADQKRWILFSAAPENIINDMFRVPGAGVNADSPSGRITFNDVQCISKDAVDFLVTLTPSDMGTYENPAVRTLLMGGKDSK